MYCKVKTDDTYKGLNILPYRKHGEEKRVDILERLRSILFYMLDNHCKVIQTRFDLHYPELQDFEYMNRDIYSFINEFIKSLNKRYCSGHYVDTKYLWVREQKTSCHPHYHIVCGNLPFWFVCRFAGYQSVNADTIASTDKRRSFSLVKYVFRRSIFQCLYFCIGYHAVHLCLHCDSVAGYCGSVFPEIAARR